MENNKFCSSCGTDLNGEKFCPNCGNKIGDAQTANIDILEIIKQPNTSKVISNGVAVVTAILSVSLLFSKWFVISLGSLGSWLGYSSFKGSCNVFNLLFKIVSLGKIADESTALGLGMLFAIALFGLGICVAVAAITTAKDVYNRVNVGSSLSSLSAFMIVEACIAMIGVWIVEACISLAMDEIGFSDYSSMVSDVVVFTNKPIIMIVIGILIRFFIRWIDETITEPENMEIKKINDEMNDEKTLKNGGWKCICGKVNPHHTEICVCGYSKQGTEADDLETLLKKSSLADLILITRDQQDLYNADEMKLIKQEIEARVVKK